MKKFLLLILENKDILLCCITGIVSVAIAGFTYYQTKKLTFFNVYFSFRAAYNEFFDNLAKVPLHTSLKMVVRLYLPFAKVISLYASEEASEYCLKAF